MYMPSVAKFTPMKLNVCRSWMNDPYFYKQLLDIWVPPPFLSNVPGILHLHPTAVFIPCVGSCGELQRYLP